MIFSMKKTITYTSLSRATINKYVALGLFPAPIPLLGSNRIGFLQSELDEWIAARVAQRDSHLKQQALNGKDNG